MANARSPLPIILVLSLLSLSAGAAVSQNRQQQLAECLNAFSRPTPTAV